MNPRKLSEQEEKDLQSLLQGCQDVLNASNGLIKKFHALGSDSRSWTAKSEQALQKLRWDQAEVTELRSRITSNVTMLDALNGSLSRLALSSPRRSPDQCSTNTMKEANTSRCDRDKPNSQRGAIESAASANPKLAISTGLFESTERFGCQEAGRNRNVAT